MSNYLRKIKRKLEREKSIYFSIQRFYPPKNNEHKRMLKKMVNEFNQPYLEGKDGSIVLLFLLKQQDSKKKQFIKCECCKEEIGIFEDITYEELKNDYPLFWNKLVEEGAIKNESKICLVREHVKLLHDLSLVKENKERPCLLCHGFSKGQIRSFAKRMERIMKGESPPLRLREGGIDLSLCLVCQQTEDDNWKNIKKEGETIFICENCLKTVDQKTIARKVEQFQNKWDLNLVKPDISYKTFLRNQEGEWEKKRKNLKDVLKKDLNLGEKDFRVDNCYNCGEEIFGISLLPNKSMTCIECKGFVVCNRQNNCQGNEVVEMVKLINAFQGKERKLIEKYLGKWRKYCQLVWICDKCRKDDRRDIPLFSLSFQTKKDSRELSEVELQKIIPQELKDFLIKNYGV